jgi:hypothetical protein
MKTVQLCRIDADVRDDNISSQHAPRLKDVAGFFGEECNRAGCLNSVAAWPVPEHGTRRSVYSARNINGQNGRAFDLLSCENGGEYSHPLIKRAAYPDTKQRVDDEIATL